ncbi:carbohydrate kinase [Polychaeton citri CBS 116435]|uniref:Gluconokinase n=1 Tax=Polychaeton citri CBS 116435 TaxID=1314669 RepID=A0A9P4Q8L8_9PEZI|nr:carbohydrate kinase [Polychaeton citri CBS 116435]
MTAADKYQPQYPLPPTPPNEQEHHYYQHNDSVDDMEPSRTPPPIVHTHEPIPNVPATTITNANALIDPSRPKHMWIVTGPAGCGKTSVASHLAESLKLPYLEGDAFHPPENVAKMAAGTPLTDADRWDWLISLREQAILTLKSAPHPAGVLLTCSALKRKYRDIMRVAAYHHPGIKIHFVFLAASEQLLLDRVGQRAGHYMKDSMVKSQFEALERRQPDEFDMIDVDASGSAEAVSQLALETVGKTMRATDERHDRLLLALSEIRGAFGAVAV